MSTNQMYVRCKRHDQTYFITTTRASSFLTIKHSISSIIGPNPITSLPQTPPSHIIFYADEGGVKELPDNGTVSDHEVGNDQVLFMVFKKEGAGDSFEEIRIMEYGKKGGEEKGGEEMKE